MTDTVGTRTYVEEKPSRVQFTLLLARRKVGDAELGREPVVGLELGGPGLLGGVCILGGS